MSVWGLWFRDIYISVSMNIIYNNNQTILTFLNKAQNKIADLASLIVEEGGEVTDNLLLLLELSDFIECLDSIYCDWTEEDIIRWIQEYNYRADLNAIPYLNITGFTTIIENSSEMPGIITTSQISDYITETTKLIKNTSHNTLSTIQGGTENERYHITKQMYDYILNMITPFKPNSVSIALGISNTLWPSGYYELGDVINTVNLQGSIIYNTNKKAVRYYYTKNNATLVGGVNTNPDANSQPNAYTDSAVISQDTFYSFVAEFSDGNYNNTKYIKFRVPMYYGIIGRDKMNNITLLQSGTKDVRDKGSMQLTFNLPVGNTLADYSRCITPYLFIPFSWGKFTNAFNSIFDFADDWKATNLNITLKDGSTSAGLLLTYNTQIEGVTTFNFNW